MSGSAPSTPTGFALGTTTSTSQAFSWTSVATLNGGGTNPVQAQSSDGFVESMGIGWNYMDSYIKQYGATAAGNIVNDLGIRYIRTRILDSTMHGAAINGVTKTSSTVNGARILVNMGDGTGNETNWEKQVQTELASYPGSIIAIEGDNEPDINYGNGQTGINQSITDFNNFYTAYNSATSTLKGIPLLSPALSVEGGGGFTARNFFTSGGANANINQVYNIIAGHWGYVGQQPEIAGWFGNAVPNLVTPLQYGSNNLPVWITEGGNPSTSAGSSSTQDFTTQAIWLPRQFMYYFANNVAKFFKYDYFIYVGDEATTGGLYNIVQYYGDDAHPSPVIPYTTSTAKPVYFALKNMIQLVSDPLPSSTSTLWNAGKMAYTMTAAGLTITTNSSGNGPTGLAANTTDPNWGIYHTLLSRQDGSFIICIWQYQTTNNGTSNGDGHFRVAPSAAINVTITVPLATSVQSATLSTTPTMNTWTNGSLAGGGAFTVPVWDYLTFVHFS